MSRWVAEPQGGYPRGGYPQGGDPGDPHPQPAPDSWPQVGPCA